MRREYRIIAHASTLIYNMQRVYAGSLFCLCLLLLHNLIHRLLRLLDRRLADGSGCLTRSSAQLRSHKMTEARVRPVDLNEILKDIQVGNYENTYELTIRPRLRNLAL